MTCIIHYCVKYCFCETSIFLIGDSIFERIYSYGMITLLNCTDLDSNINIQVEKYDFSWNQGLQCNGYGVKRIGYTIHWGVNGPPYHRAYKTHKFPGSTIDSRTNILMAVDEFLNRLDYPNEQAIFVYCSALWDIKRATDHPHLYNFTGELSMKIS